MGCSKDEACEVLFRNALIVDGSGAPSYVGDVKVCGDTITSVTPAKKSTRTASGLVVDCDGLVLTPGFIDIHNHSDVTPFIDPSAMNYVTQGVTTLLVGHCGHSAAPHTPDLPTGDQRIPWNWSTFAEYLSAIDALPKTINIAALVGHGQVRLVVVGPEDRAPTPEELETMKAHVREAMEAGAFGLSTGLIYAPGIYAKTCEVIELAKVAGEYGGLYATHLRSEADLMVDAVMEAVQIGRASGTRVQVAHHKASGRRNWGLVKTTLEVMEYSRKTGVEITCDVYPCTPSGASIFAIMPGWARSGGKKGLAQALKDPAKRNKIRKELAKPSLEWENILFDAGFDGLLVTSSKVFPEYQGKTIGQIAREQGKEPMDFLLELADQDLDVGMIAGGMSEDDMRFILKHRLSMICSDSAVVEYGVGCPHPRNYRAFTRALATYVRDEAVLSLEQAVYKMSGFPAWKMGLHDRGLIKPGAKADIAVFDYWGLSYKSDFGDPHHYSEGMVHVMVNGQFVMKDGKVTEKRPGRALKRPY